MAYADKRSLRDRGAGMAGVVIIHAGLAAVLVFGLATDVTQEILSGPLPTTEYKDPPPPPPPDPQPQKQAQPTETVIFTPKPPVELPPRPNFVETMIEPPDFSDEVVLKVLPPVVDPGPAVTPGIKPVAAIPRNNPSRWVTDSDYSSRWIREELYGNASFRLEIAANGKVENCSITKSTGHKALDDATCSLVTRRAKFKPATDSSGNATQGSYSSTIRWVLPE